MEVHCRAAVRGALSALGLVLLASAPLEAASLKGTVRLSPPFPDTTVIPVEERYAHCGNEQISQRLLITPAGELQNVVVSLDAPSGSPEPAAGDAPPEPLLLRQKGCQFDPHVLILSKGAPFLVTNEDPMAHDVRAFLGPKILFRFEMEEGAKPIERRFEEPGRIVIRCGLHSWMHAIVISAEHSHVALTDARGQFFLEGLPAGDFELSLWHELLGEARQSVHLGEGASQDIVLTYPAFHSS